MENVNKNIIYEVSARKTGIKGLWKDENGKVYFDNIKLFFPACFDDFKVKIDLLFLAGEKAVFIETKEKAFIVYENENPLILSHRVRVQREKLSFNEIKTLLNIAGGITIFKDENGYTLQYWKV